MSETKAKPKKAPARGNKFAFSILWLIGHVAAWGAFIPIADVVDGFPRNDFLFFTLLAIVVGGITSSVQYALMRWQFGRNIKAWIPTSIVAWLLATLVVVQPIVNLGLDQLEITLQALALYLPATIFQTILLRRHVQQAWLWLLASVAGSFAFALPIANDGGDMSVLLGYGFYAMTMAITLIYLFGMSQNPKLQTDTIKQKDNLDEVNRLVEQYPDENYQVQESAEQYQSTR